MSAVALSTALPRVDLLPKSEIERRQRRTLAGTWIRIGLMVLVLTVALCGGAWFLNFEAQQRLSTEQARTTALITELASLQPVSNAMAERATLQGYVAQAMSGDLVWSKVLTDVSRTLPAGVTLTEFTLTAGPAPAGEDRAAEVGLMGTLTLSGADPLAFDAAVKAIRALPAMILVNGTDLAEKDSSYAFTVAVTVDQSVYTNKFETKQGQK